MRRNEATTWLRAFALPRGAGDRNVLESWLL